FEIDLARSGTCGDLIGYSTQRPRIFRAREIARADRTIVTKVHLRTRTAREHRDDCGRQHGEPAHDHYYAITSRRSARPSTSGEMSRPVRVAREGRAVQMRGPSMLRAISADA